MIRHQRLHNSGWKCCFRWRYSIMTCSKPLLLIGYLLLWGVLLDPQYGSWYVDIRRYKTKNPRHHISYWHFLKVVVNASSLIVVNATRDVNSHSLIGILIPHSSQNWYIAPRKKNKSDVDICRVGIAGTRSRIAFATTTTTTTTMTTTTTTTTTRCQYGKRK